MTSCISRSLFRSLQNGCRISELGHFRIYKQMQVRTKMTETPLTRIFGYKFMHKFDEKSKIIVLDGNLAVGKTSLAADLAEKLGMKYVPECTTNYLAEKHLGQGLKADITYSGDISLERFYANPQAEDGHTFRFQMMMYVFRFLQYGDVVTHLLETGQGVVMERSVFSDFVFLEAVMEMGWIRKQCYDLYEEVKGVSLYRMKHPHAIVYLDIPPEMAHQRFIERGKGDEKKVPLEYFQALDRAYKEKFLPVMRAEGVEVLEYDWREYGHTARIVDDINFLKCEDSEWQHSDDFNLDKHYRFLTNSWKMADSLVIPRFVPEMTYSGKQFDSLEEEYKAKFDKEYAPGYNPREYAHIVELMFNRR